MTAATSNVAARRTARLLVTLTLIYNSIEGVAAVAAGILAGSIALVGFGLDSAIEVSASAVVLVHLLRRNEDEDSDWEQRAAVFVGLTFLALAAYVGFESVSDLIRRSKPDASYFGIAIACLSLAFMPLLARIKHDKAHQIGSRALEAESRETLVCSYLSAALLVGLGANALLGWWWADPVAALVIVAFLAKEAWEAITRRELCCID
ncbi:MAG TPA: cation transporter [Dehalococcoidia bacterium]|nr:cation transporter [Dehalococcoidia bacterium]